MSAIAGKGGSVIGGRAAMLVDRNALRHLAGDRWSCLISGTNGKTTTTHMVAAAMADLAPVTNAAGANLVSGLISCLATDLTAPAVLEVDEATLPSVMAQLGPAIVVLLNLSRDQLDRYGEVHNVARKWRQALAAHRSVHVVANGDDPLVAWVAEAHPGPRTWVAAGQGWKADSVVCLECGGLLLQDGPDWSCPCGRRRPDPSFSLADGVLTGPDLPPTAVSVMLPGAVNQTNAAMAVAAAAAAGVEPARALQLLAAVTEVAGRYTVAHLDGREIRLLMAKNPAGWTAALELIHAAPAPVVVAINARIADGADPSWLWDVPFEHLGNRPVVAAGDRALDLAVRLRYAGLEPVVHRGPILAAAHLVSEGRVDLIANYTAFQQARREARG